MRKDSEKIINLLKQKGIRPSIHRIEILKYFYQNRNHPTVDTIYLSLKNEFPTLSKATIYNTLDLFNKKNLTTSLDAEGNETRYDLAEKSHAHFICEDCGKIYDIDVDFESIDSKELENFSVNKKNVYFKGICPKCLLKE